MGVKLVIAVTDSDWFSHLRQRPDLREVNFWAPRPGNFKALQPGELFLFKLKAPHHVIVGGGIFAHANMLPCSLAWKAFGAANGAGSAERMRMLIARNRRADPYDRSDFVIGCRILTQPFFLDEPDWIPVPESFSRNIVRFKTYTTADAEGRELWEAVGERLHRQRFPGMERDRARFATPQLIRPRLGQGAFRLVITDNYDRRCAVTRERTLPALEAAHIRPYSEHGSHEPGNGILLRSDIHNLFDAGYVTVTPDHRFEVSARIREEFENGRHYYALHGQRINAPEDASRRPDPASLAWHNQNCFRG